MSSALYKLKHHAWAEATNLLQLSEAVMCRVQFSFVYQRVLTRQS